ncbi:MAG: hypothetical protein FJ403_23260 [Verrucomicrobia bacterium]|nr:hypothetical protein [Verrucomicrobiota bacterium]
MSNHKFREVIVPLSRPAHALERSPDEAEAEALIGMDTDGPITTSGNSYLGTGNAIGCSVEMPSRGKTARRPAWLLLGFRNHGRTSVTVRNHPSCPGRIGLTFV